MIQPYNQTVSIQMSSLASREKKMKQMKLVYSLVSIQMSSLASREGWDRPMTEDEFQSFHSNEFSSEQRVEPVQFRQRWKVGFHSNEFSSEQREPTAPPPVRCKGDVSIQMSSLASRESNGIAPSNSPAANSVSIQMSSLASREGHQGRHQPIYSRGFHSNEFSSEQRGGVCRGIRGRLQEWFPFK